MSSRAAIRYAKALLQNATESSTQAVVFGDMQSVYNTIQGSRELQVALQSRVITLEEKKNVLLKIFSGQSEATHSLIQVLVNNKRAELLPEASKSFIDLYNDQQGVKVATVTTAVELTGDMESKVMAKLKSLTGTDSISLKKEVDPEILGGFILRVGDIQYDASIVNQFRNLRKEFKIQYN